MYDKSDIFLIATKLNEIYKKKYLIFI